MFNVIFLIFIYIHKLFEFESQFNLMIKDFSNIFFLTSKIKDEFIQYFPLISFVCIQVYTIFSQRYGNSFKEVFSF